MWWFTNISWRRRLWVKPTIFQSYCAKIAPSGSLFMKGAETTTESERSQPTPGNRFSCAFWRSRALNRSRAPLRSKRSSLFSLKSRISLARNLKFLKRSSRRSWIPEVSESGALSWGLETYQGLLFQGELFQKSLHTKIHFPQSEFFLTNSTNYT